MIPVLRYNTKAGRKKIDEILARPVNDYAETLPAVEQIVADVRKNGDAAVCEYTKRFDGADIDAGSIRVTPGEITAACERTDPHLLSVFKTAVSRIGEYHMRQKPKGWLEKFDGGELMGQLVSPLYRVGIYTPGGAAPLPSSLLMCAVPAKIAGVNEIAVATPPDKNGEISPVILAAAAAAGITEIYKAGGAQAVAMLAFGTKSVKKVDKIVGPGSIYVTLAKRCVFGHVGIDSTAGPSEILIIADGRANPGFIAADLLAQAEHGAPAPAMLITTSEALAAAVVKELEKRIKTLPRKKIIEESLARCGAVVIVDKLREAVDISNTAAPEHLALCVKNPLELLGLVKNAGAIFLGEYTPEAIGDYIAGPSHVLPTGGSARYFSPLSVDDFIKKSSVMSFDKRACRRIGADAALFAEAEGLLAHAESVRARLS